MIAKLLEKVATSIENAQFLDPLAKLLTAINLKVWGHGAVRNIISGTPIGHPAHPLLVAVPIGSWTSALVYDLLGDDAAATASIGIGLVAAVPSAVTGASDWAYTTGAERRVGLVHATLNSLAVTAYASSWFARRRGDRAAGVGLSLVGATILVGSGWLGGHLAYALGVGVDTTAFQQIPEGWHDVAAEDDIVAGTLTQVELDGVSVVVTRGSAGQVVAYADRCTHRGGPLHEGKITDGCVQCPWHASEFSIDDGTVVRGPASRPQPKLGVRISAGRVAVSRPEHERTLRKNPVGH